MDPRERYFDNAATTPPDPRVVREMMPYLDEGWGNAHSIHDPGRRAMAAVDLARERIAALVGAEDPAEIAFTSGATEANNWVIRAHPTGAMSPFEHSSVREPGLASGYTILSATGHTVEPGPEVDLVTVMSVNNETGAVIDPTASLGEARALHSDVTQALGKMPSDLQGIDLASFSGHKIYGPKGIGGLYAREARWPEPLLRGGEQEYGVRAGTLNVPAIVGFGVAAEIAAESWEEDAAKAREMRAVVLEATHAAEPLINEGQINVPHILSLSFLGVEGEALVIDMDHRGYAISSGAACSSRSTEPSHVLLAMGLPGERVRGTVRISFGRFNSVDAAAELGRSLCEAVARLRRE